MAGLSAFTLAGTLCPEAPINGVHADVVLLEPCGIAGISWRIGIPARFPAVPVRVFVTGDS